MGTKITIRVTGLEPIGDDNHWDGIEGWRLIADTYVHGAPEIQKAVLAWTAGEYGGDEMRLYQTDQPDGIIALDDENFDTDSVDLLRDLLLEHLHEARAEADKVFHHRIFGAPTRTIPLSPGEGLNLEGVAL